MKKILNCLLILFCVLSLTSCSSKDEEDHAKVNAFEIKTASNVVDNYMGYIMKADYENGKKLYTKELLKKVADMPTSDIKIKGYKITESNEVGRSGIFKVRITRTSMATSLSCLDEYSIKIVKDGAEYKVSEVISAPQKEAFVNSIGIRFRDKTNVKTNLIIDESGLPKYAYAKEDVARLYKIPVPLKKFGPINFSYEGDKLAVSTYEKNSFIGVVYIDESLAVQGNTGDSTGQSTDSGGSEEIAKEKPIGKELIPIDMLLNCKVEFMTFSQDEKFLVVQYDKEKSGKYIRVYQVDNGQMIPVDFEKDYPIDKVQIIFSSFGEDSMTYEVIPRSNAKGTDTDIIGKWKLDLKKFTVDKL
ncbi:hypothetical protein LGK95_15580 [Clostridium algoriphilum]|uniref:hypothetical protein n=1 Tax=Clostridium algoriphilum TaxID=198347 RepID=UPI001CF2C175|nr:hypothetical protein [Clostridium algoriphilum]MCB2294908.1 hypothetical protein [Clostridium algoriphilum]